MARKKDPLAGVPQISEKKLQSLLRQADSTKKKTSELAGEFGEAVRNAIEKDHLHRKAFNIIKGLNRMENEKLAELWHTLLLYADMGGLMTRIESVPSLKLVHNADAETGEEAIAVAAE